MNFALNVSYLIVTVTDAIFIAPPIPVVADLLQKYKMISSSLCVSDFMCLSCVPRHRHNQTIPAKKVTSAKAARPICNKLK